MKLSRVFKSVAAIVVICALLCGTLASCAVIPSDRSLKKAYKNAINEVLEKIEYKNFSPLG